MLNTIYKINRYILNEIVKYYSQFIGSFLFKINNISYQKGVSFNGLPTIYIQGTVQIGKNFKINNRINANPIGRNHKCLFVVRQNAKLLIGNNVGMSGTTIVCQKKITIKDNVKFGGNVCIYDTDFHSLNSLFRSDSKKDQENTVKKEVTISDNVFIGAHSTILKGVTVGENAIIGACSVVAKDIPSNEIWAGNPAKFIRKIN